MIDTVLFDMGGTLEDIRSTPLTQERAAQAIAHILQQNGLEYSQPAQGMAALLREGLRRYFSRRDQNNMELKPEQIWPDYMLSELHLNRKKVRPSQKSWPSSGKTGTLSAVCGRAFLTCWRACKRWGLNWVLSATLPACTM